VVGTVSIHPLKALPIGSPNRMRWIGDRPRSGLWKRKDGRQVKSNVL
jgi:large subunit ribosomal protein L2